MPTRVFFWGAWEEEPFSPQRTFICSFWRSQMNLCTRLPFLQRSQSHPNENVGENQWASHITNKEIIMIYEKTNIIRYLWMKVPQWTCHIFFHNVPPKSNRFMFSFRSVTRLDFVPLLPPMRLELKAEEQACSGSPGGPVTLNKQTGKEMELQYG